MQSIKKTTTKLHVDLTFCVISTTNRFNWSNYNYLNAICVLFYMYTEQMEKKITHTKTKKKKFQLKMEIEFFLSH